MEETKIQQKEVAWSMDSEILRQIANMLELSNKFYLQGNLTQSFFCLKNAKNLCINSLNSDERKELKKMENDTRMSLVTNRWNRDTNWIIDMGPRSKEVEERQLLIKKHAHKFPTYLEDYREKLMDLLDSYSYLQKKKKDKTEMGI